MVEKNKKLILGIVAFFIASVIVYIASIYAAAPDIVVHVPANTTYSSTTVSLNWSITGYDSVFYSLDGAANVTSYKADGTYVDVINATPCDTLEAGEDLWGISVANDRIYGICYDTNNYVHLVEEKFVH